MTTQCTQGPWSYEHDNGNNPRIVSLAIDPGTGKPCVVVDLTCAMRTVGPVETSADEMTANAHMLAASHAMFTALDGLINNGFSDEELARRWSWRVEAIREAREAFAKAKGENYEAAR